MTKFLPKSRAALLCVIYAVTAVSLVTANLCAIKNESLLGLSIGGGIVTIVIDYVLSDVTAEVFGLRKALAVRRAAMLCNVFSVLTLQVVVWLPSYGEFAIGNEFSTIFTAAPLMVVASMAAYMCGTYVNDKVMQRMHDRHGESSLFARCIASTVLGGLVDTVVYTVVAYGLTYSAVANFENAILTYVLKVLVEVVVFHAVTKHVIAWAKRLPE